MLVPIKALHENKRVIRRVTKVDLAISSRHINTTRKYRVSSYHDD